MNYSTDIFLLFSLIYVTKQISTVSLDQQLKIMPLSCAMLPSGLQPSGNITQLLSIIYYLLSIIVTYILTDIFTRSFYLRFCTFASVRFRNKMFVRFHAVLFLSQCRITLSIVKNVRFALS